MKSAPAAICTPRLMLRPFDATDAAALFVFMSDSVAMKHTYVAKSLESCVTRLESYEVQRERLGFAPWVVRSSNGGDIIGWGGLSVDPQAPEWGLEVGYVFSPLVWGRGYATELVGHALAHAFSGLVAPEVHAFAKPENTASVRVLIKCGFSLLKFEPALQRNHYLICSPNMR